MAGKPPHVPLRFAAGTSGEQRVFVHRRYSKHASDPHENVSTSDRWTLVAQVQPGAYQGSFTGTIGTLLEEVDEFSPLLRVEVGPRGPIGAFEKLRDEPQWLYGVVEHLLTALPEEAIGEGAVWQTIVADVLGPGRDLRLVTELLETRDDTWHLKGEIGMQTRDLQPLMRKTDPSQPADASVQGEFEVWWKPGDPLPHRGLVKEQRTTYASNGTDVEVIELVLDSGSSPTIEDSQGGW